MSGTRPLARPPLAPLRLTSLRQIESSIGGPRKALFPHALRALFQIDFAVRSASLGCSCAHFPPDFVSWRAPFFASTRRAIFENKEGYTPRLSEDFFASRMVLRVDAKKGPATRRSPAGKGA